jgi:hypothetical protein
MSIWRQGLSHVATLWRALVGLAFELKPSLGRAHEDPRANEQWEREHSVFTPRKY